MTKFMTMPLVAINTKKSNKTIFKFKVGTTKIDVSEFKPEDFEIVMFIYHDEEYGDVFLAWDEGEEEQRILFFGEKGDEFD